MDPKQIKALLESAGDLGNPVEAAQNAFRRGLIRLACLVLNDALIRKVDVEGVWKLKVGLFCRFFGYSDITLRMLKEAYEAGAPAGLTISYGCALQARGNHREAIDLYQKFIEQEPLSEQLGVAIANRANAILNLGDLSTAEQQYQKAIAIDPGTATHYYNYGHCLRLQGRFQAALDNIDQGFARLPADSSESSAFWLEKANILAGLQRGAEALDCVDKARLQGADPSRLHYVRGRALGQVGRLSEARRQLKMALEKEPEHPDVRNALKVIEQALANQPWWKRLFG